jgi:hypothetical protein
MPMLTAMSLWESKDAKSPALKVDAARAGRDLTIRRSDDTEALLGAALRLPKAWPYLPPLLSTISFSCGVTLPWPHSTD